MHINNSNKPLYLLNYLYYELFTCMECILATQPTPLGVNKKLQVGYFGDLKRTKKKTPGLLIGPQVNRWDVYVCQIYLWINMLKAKTSSFFSSRTKWKRQTAVGLELLAEAGNYSALQRMFPSPYFYPQSLVSNLDPGAALYLYRGPSAPPPALQRPLVPRILLHGLQGGSEPPPPPPPLPPMSGVLPRPAQQR